MSRWIRMFVACLALAATSVSPAQSNPPAQNPASRPADNPPIGEQPATDRQPAPRLVLSATEWNFGQVWYGDPCSTQIELTNTGAAPLKIIHVKSSCGCTVAKPRKTELAPGETDTMTVTYNTRKNAKKVNQTITIKTNDPLEPQKRFRVLGQVWHVFDAQPAMRATFGLLKPGSEKTTTIELRSNMAEKVTPRLRPLGPEAPFEARLEEVETGVQYKLIVRTKPTLEPGSNFSTAILETGVERLPTMSIRISATVLEHVSVRPGRLVVSAGSKPTPRLLLVNYAEDEPIEITEVKASHPSVKMVGLPTRRPPSKHSEFAAYQLRVTLPAFDEFPAEKVTIEIHTNHPDPKFQKLVVPVEKLQPRRPATNKGAPKAGQKLKPVLKPLPPKAGPGAPAGKPD